MADAQGQRNISHSHFRDNTLIHQGSGHVNIHHYPRQQARPEAVRVIPYPRNEDMVDRQDIAASLDALLPQPQAASSRSAALWGLGGSGKTQIALDFAYRQCDDSECSVFWVHADTEATFLADYKTIGKSLEVDISLDGADLLDAVRRRIEARPPWVMILDNADDLRLFGVNSAGEGTREGLYRYIPQLARGTILWTSRDKNITGTLVGARRGIEVRAMTDNEATILLARTRDVALTDEEEGVTDLLEELQRLPLAISQAGAYMRRMSMTAKEYLGLLGQGKNRWQVLEKSDFDRHRRPAVSNSVLETWRISIERIREESEMSYRILHVVAYVGSQDIPYELIIAASREDVDDARLEDSEQTAELKIQQAALRLQEFSFLTMVRKEDGGRSYDMHKLVQEAVRYGLHGRSRTNRLESEPTRRAAFYSRMAMQIVDGLFPVSEQKSWEQCEQYLPHVIEASKWAETADMRIETAALLNRVSDFFNDRGRWGEKEPVDVRAWELQREILGEEHPSTLTSMNNLAATYRNQGRWVEAETLEVQVMETTQRVLGEEHPSTLLSMAKLASTYQGQARYNEAETLHTAVLSLQQRILGDAHPDTAQSMLDLAAPQECLRHQKVVKTGSPSTASGGEAHDTGRWRRYVAGTLMILAGGIAMWLGR